MELQPTVTYRARGAMVASIDHLASSAGLAMLRVGGNAADAAIATSAVLAVTSQHLCGLGGDLFAIVVPPTGRPEVLNSSGRSGSGASAERLRSAGHRVMPFRGDIASVTVPGCVDGWLALHERYGSLPFETLLEPARRYAEEGFPASPTLATEYEAVRHLAEAADYTSSGPLRPGTMVRREGVARTLRSLATAGREGFYEGEFGTELLELGAGEFEPDDLREPLAEWVEALSIEAFGATIWSAPPNSQGYLTLASAAIASGLDLPRDPASDAFAHVLVESARQAAHDRLAFLAEGADARPLLDPAAIDRRRAGIDLGHAAELGDRYREGGTIALCAVDEQRLGVCILQSNASGFGSHLVLPGLRIFLHNRGIGFSLEAGHPAEYGPRRRPPHTLCPTAVTTLDGSLRGVLGTMGGDSQPQILLQLLARWLHCGEDPGDAIAAGRFVLVDPEGGTTFDTWRHGGTVDVAIEGHAPEAWTAGLARRGHHTRPRPAYHRAFGHAHLIAVDGDGLAGATDPRPRAGAVAAR